MAYTTDANGIPILEKKSLLTDVPEYTQALAPHVAAVDTLLRQLMPLGTIAPYYKSTAPNGMWLICNGDPAPSGDQYDEYRAEIGIHTPDLRGRTLIGQGQGVDENGDDLTNRSFGGDGGFEDHVLSYNEMPQHTHLLHADYMYQGVGADSFRLGDASPSKKQGVVTSTDSAGNSWPHNNMQPYLVVNYIILASYEA